MSQASIQSAAYSRQSSVGAERRRGEAKELLESNLRLREAQALIQRNPCYERDMSPLARDAANYESRMLNDDSNYGMSPAAKRAR